MRRLVDRAALDQVVLERRDLLVAHPAPADETQMPNSRRMELFQ